MSHLRKYQDVLARAAQEPGNHVVVLPTGAGKTLVSFEVIFVALLRHPEKIVVFLAPTILLVNQQHQDWQASNCFEHLGHLNGKKATCAKLGKTYVLIEIHCRTVKIKDVFSHQLNLI